MKYWTELPHLVAVKVNFYLPIFFFVFSCINNESRQLNYSYVISYSMCRDTCGQQWVRVSVPVFYYWWHFPGSILFSRILQQQICRVAYCILVSRKLERLNCWMVYGISDFRNQIRRSDLRKNGFLKNWVKWVSKFVLLMNFSSW